MKHVSAFFVLVAALPAAGSAAPLPFEEAVRAADRIVVGSVKSVGEGSTRVGGVDIPLGIKEAGLVFTPYKFETVDCLFDRRGECSTGTLDVLVPGGTVLELVGGEAVLRTWEVKGPAGAPLPADGTELVMFLQERRGRYQPLNDPGARLAVERSSQSLTVVFESPRFLSQHAGSGTAASPITGPPRFTESISIERLRSLIPIVRSVLKPTSSTDHAVSDRTAMPRDPRAP